MKVSQFAVKHPVVIGMLLIVLGVFGILSVSSINVEFMGDISMPSVIVVAVYPGADAQDMEEDVTSVLEDDFVTLPDFKVFIFFSSMSKQVTSLPSSANPTPVGRPTYPVPITVIFIAYISIVIWLLYVR